MAEETWLKIENPTFAFVSAFVDELVRAGVQDVVVCPGSRSTPFAYGFAGNPGLKLWMEYDERSAGFFALGLAKSTRQAVALVCTSGTAAANFMPAVVEAKQGRVPLIILTADRPAELRDNGAPQAIDQLKLYGSYAKWFAEMPLPEASNQMLRFARTQAGRAVGIAQAAPAGPVHLNQPFREPLTPAPIAGQPLPPESQRDPVAWEGRPNGQPYVELIQASRRLQTGEVSHLARTFESIEKGLIIVGPQDDPTMAPAVAALAQRLGYPVLADPLSGLRAGPHDQDYFIPNYDAFLRDTRFTTGAEFEPEVVIRFGAMPTAKPLLLFLNRFPDLPQYVVDGGDGWNEPTQLAQFIYHADPVLFSYDLVTTLPAKTEKTAWLRAWLDCAHITAETLNTALRGLPELFEGRVLAAMADLLPNNATLFVGNSMPVRDLDSFFPNSPKNIRLLCNRGANGIDGVVSTALGVAASQPGPLVLVIGDLSTYHDLNGLLAAKLHRLNATIVILNNDGGGIFSFLSQASYPHNFEQLFGTPHGLDFKPVTEMYGARFSRVEDWPGFEAAMQTALKEDGLKVIEVPTNRASNVTMHRQMWTAVYQALAATGNEAVTR
ncbi:MAG: 2-succinyl-5-enolpyruvyl-6-hydroxy-3-cyclohexene-1-carboxylic-acid synthase [Chloroflexi bacterium]|nr:2-succinyl-5-enolpyruvyl-6-hydroxy-3-cyclohexene-1-carboxylic-acid synthase [Chloroflexota bacterium]OJV93268.1 MAG: 2-succinyl-5-enolpyruvyl-6-hydroxy-3-cyclohexene-1-carboxylic-acid synthase [Chloroflexi bacterium 54-19]